MSDVTQKDFDLAALIIRNSEVSHGSKLIAAHRIAAEKSVLELARMRAIVLFQSFVHGVASKHNWSDDAVIHAVDAFTVALADALETKPIGQRLHPDNPHGKGEHE